MMKLLNILTRSIATSGAQRPAANTNIDKGYFELKKVQEHFQRNDGKPVFLKGSFADQVLYRLTVGLSLVGIGGMVKLFWELSVPKKND